MTTGLKKHFSRFNTISGNGNQNVIVTGVTSPVSATDVPSSDPAYVSTAGLKRVYHKFTTASSITFNTGASVNNYNHRSNVIGGVVSNIPTSGTSSDNGSGITAAIIAGGGTVLGVKRTGGGGGGGYRGLTGLSVTLGTPYPITIGAAQGNSAAFGFTANAGGNEGTTGGSGGGGGAGGGAGAASLTCPPGTGVPWNTSVQGSYGTKGGGAGDAAGGGGGGAGGAGFNPGGLESPPAYPTGTFATNPGGDGLTVFGDSVAGGGTGGYHGGGTAPAGPPIGGGGGGGGDGSGGTAGNPGAVYVSYLTPL